MLKFFEGLILSLSMYTIIPMPQTKWKEENFPFILVNLPLVGFFIGILWYILSLILVNSNFHKEMITFIIMIFPLITTGFIHIDGYMDTCDAIFSRASLEKKREILKDSRVGAFAVIFVVALTLFYFSSIIEIIKKDIIYLKALIFIPVISRCIAVLFAIKTKLISESGFIATFRKNMNNFHFFIVLFILIISIIISYLLGGIFLIKIAIFNILIGIIVSIYCTKQMDGISGDLCGFIIIVSSGLTIGFLSIV